ncbi:hypothetical protein NP511_00285 [Natrinema thermotolerans]|uniref:DUF7344 domain-containing protein n=1 Tax=Natrinema thermotolerans TaxID=121872 RepID=A0AAF0T1R2_9EURY|nr:hypothetical protein [Natrinema thermotolerans]QCC60429.1 hypothetical protein DVR14_18035 [Natrinema thermotolerans]QCC61334.1 hypothetical protein DVR14_22165 [Natrinema thermotolerans]WMT07457.1 hypothetical protein NP511_19000 [Natrinema thermotolerans]WMT08089.1 hypothetical protein NP511_00285 [Natrinema thermotolerans]
MREREGVSTLQADAMPSLDLVFDLLSNRRRRYALYYLNQQSDGVATVAALAQNVVAFERIAAEDADRDSARSPPDRDADPADERETVRVELRHVHLPKLEDAGVLEHDRRSETVRYWGQPSLEEWLEHAHHKEMS